ncbi:MAG: C_GCAxxG_C_C family protein [Clostridia bacterium]|nr:C_GCAxxG_C_C family protein [Clostridia bacterium]
MADEKELIQAAKDNAAQNFRAGLNCAESVVQAILDTGTIDGLPPEVVALATPFGGGMGLSGHTCGALAGMLMAVGAAHGRRYPMAEPDPQKRQDQLYGNPGLYRFFNQIPRRFRERFGYLNCREINQGYEDWFAKDRLKRCMKITIEAAGMAMEYILQGKKEGYAQPFGENMARKQ